MGRWKSNTVCDLLSRTGSKPFQQRELLSPLPPWCPGTGTTPAGRGWVLGKITNSPFAAKQKTTSPVWNRSQSIALLSKFAQQFQLNSVSQEWIHPPEHLSNPLDYSLNLSVFQIIYWNFLPCTIPDLIYPTEHSETRGRAGAAPLGLSILCFCAALQVLAAPHQPFRICTFPDNSLEVHFLCSCRSQNERFASVNRVFFHLRFQEKQLSDGFWNLQQI